MRHRKRKHKLGVSDPHRLALLANLSVALITHGRIKTTLAKAKGLRPFVEKVITLAKKAANANEPERKLHFRRLAIERLRDPGAAATLFDERVREFMERPGGYTRIYKLGQRIGDAAEMALIELIDATDEGYPKKSSRKMATKSGTKDADKAKPKEDSKEEVAEDTKATDTEAETVAEPVEAEDAVSEAKSSETESAEAESSEPTEEEPATTEDAEEPKS